MAAYECDPDIIEFALSQKVILASPITLLGFMKAIAYGWQQFVISKNAKVILEQGKELHKRAAIWLEFFRKTGEKIGSVIDAYNASVSSLQTRFFPAARRFEELTSLTEELSDVATINKGLNLAPRTQDVGCVPKLIEAAPLFDAQPTSQVATWFVTRDGKSKEGPFTWDKLAELLDSDTLENTAMALADGETQWMPVGVIKERYKANVRLLGPNG